MESREEQNIFIAHTPLQNMIVSRIVQQYFRSESHSNYLFTSVLPEQNVCFKGIYTIDKSSTFRKILQTYAAKNRIKKLLDRNGGNLFIPHTGALLDNYFFYSYPHKDRNVFLNFYYDGILYFYKYLEPYRKEHHRDRERFAKLLGFKYQREPEIFPAEHPDVTRIYSVFPEFTLGPDHKLKEVSLQQEDYRADSRAVLILGGKPSLLTHEEVQTLYGLMIEDIIARPEIDTVYFKGHHADPSDNFERANKNRLTVEDITQSKPVEEIIGMYRPSIIYSYPSSGLVNIRAMYGDRLQVISYYIKPKRDNLKTLWPIFEKLNIYTTMVAPEKQKKKISNYEN